MPLEDIGAIEALLCGASTARAEAADHRSLVMGEGVSILVVLPSETLGVVFTSRNRALLGSLVLVSEHVSLQVLHMSTAGCDGAQAFVGVL